MDRSFIIVRSALLLSLVLGAASCRQTPAEAPPMSVSVQQSRRDPQGLAPEPAPAPDPAVAEAASEAGAEELAPEPAGPRAYSFKPRLGETVSLYSTWTGRSSEELVGLLGLRSARHLRAGRAYTLTLEPAEWERFRRTREMHVRERREAFLRGHHVEGYRRYAVRRGDSAAAIASRHRVPQWLLHDANRGLDLTRIHPGEIVEVPLLADGPASEEDAPTLTGPTPVLAPRDEIPTPAPATRRALPTQKGSPLRADLHPTASRHPTASVATSPEGEAPEPGKAVAEAAPRLSITLKRGESLALLARFASLKVVDLAEANGIDDPNRVQAGRALRIPLDPERWAGFIEARTRHELLRHHLRAYRVRGYRIERPRLRAGEKLGHLIRRTGCDPASLRTLNPGLRPRKIRAGRRLRVAIPPARTQSDNLR